jgi:hypothetical protein
MLLSNPASSGALSGQELPAEAENAEAKRKQVQVTIKCTACIWFQTELLGDHSEREPPDPIPNSEVKPLSADDSVAVCHVKVGNRQAPNTCQVTRVTWLTRKTPATYPVLGFFYARDRLGCQAVLTPFR